MVTGPPCGVNDLTSAKPGSRCERPAQSGWRISSHGPKASSRQRPWQDFRIEWNAMDSSQEFRAVIYSGDLLKSGPLNVFLRMGRISEVVTIKSSDRTAQADSSTKEPIRIHAGRCTRPHATGGAPARRHCRSTLVVARGDRSDVRADLSQGPLRTHPESACPWFRQRSMNCGKAWPSSMRPAVPGLRPLSRESNQAGSNLMIRANGRRPDQPARTSIGCGLALLLRTQDQIR